MNKTTSILLATVLVIGMGFMFLKQPTESVENVEIRDGIQYITVTAQGGYSPRLSSAQANIPTKLIVETNGTYDCSAALVIEAVDYQEILPSSGEEVIDLGTPAPGTLQGLCSMGMYSFTINFN
jgi:plastocyanin domain-containing protein